ncbi:hypothetical protein CE91St28_19520 [Pyramidobacter piscolens]|nr:hypothetical protein CE91St28_19520 [Pyramidobacter piscolens]
MPPSARRSVRRRPRRENETGNGGVPGRNAAVLSDCYYSEIPNSKSAPKEIRKASCADRAAVETVLSDGTFAGHRAFTVESFY